ncbi:MAG: glycosyltransferase family 4 protein [Planctomycetes bacterium]|nr:glycosyltransferase family 4 protein [Planctomycetota bacterium]
MKIAFITSFFPPDRVAGAELGTHFMAKYMAEKGHEVHVLITRPKVEKYREELRDGYIIHWLGAKRLKGFRFFSEVADSIKCLKTIKPDIVHGNCLLPGGYVAAQYGKKYGAKSVLLCYGYDVCDMSKLQAYWGRKALRGVDLALAATEYCSGVMKNWAPDINPQIYYAGCDIEAFPLLAEHRDSKVIKLLFIGRMIPVKGFELLLNLMAKLPENYQLDVLGQGELLQDYKQKSLSLGLEGRIHFHGLVPNKDIQHYFSKAHCLVLPSRREPFGVVAIEAICSGVPVVGAHVMGLPEAVASERNGFVVKNREVADWEKAIRLVCENSQLRSQLYQNAKEDRGKWAWSAQLRVLENMYQKLISKIGR